MTRPQRLASLASRRSRATLGIAISLGVVVAWATLGLFPFYWALITSIKPPTSVIEVPPTLFPREITFGNYSELAQNSLLLRWTVNSLIVAFTATVSNVVLSAMAGYALAKGRFAGRNLMFSVVIALLMVSNQVLIVPLFMIVNGLELTDTYLGLVLPFIVTPLGVFLAKQFMQTIPTELLHAARIDGCSEWGVFWRVVVPISRPVLTVIAIFSFINLWNDFLWPLVASSRSEMRTLQVGLATLQQLEVANVGLLMAGAVYAVIPPIAVFFLFQRSFIEGATVGSLKG